LKHRFLCLPAIILLLFTAILTQSGCKENIVINSKVSPSNNAIVVYDTILPVITHTYFDDSAVTSTSIGGIPIYQGVGAITDPYFGTMTGATFFQVLFTTASAALYDPSAVIVDSAILVLPYSGYTYGDSNNTNLTQTYQVFYMEDTLSYYTNYYSYSTAAIDAISPLSDPTTVNISSLKDSFGINVLPFNYPGLRIKLKLPILLSKLQTGLNVFTNSTNPVGDWLSAFHGVCVRVADTRQFTTAIPYFQLDGGDIHSEAGILVYYHEIVDPTYTDSESYYFNATVCAHFNSITKSYSQFPVNKLLHSTAANDPVIALQNQPGASLDIVIPGIKSLPKGIINQAELEFTLLPDAQYYNFGIYAGPERLYPIGIANGNYPTGISAGLSYNIADRYPLTSITPLTVMDGYVHALAGSNGSILYTYTLGLPREVMSSIAANNDTIHLHINGTEDYYGAFHMVAGGGSYSDSNYRAKLKVVYSKLTNQ